MVPGPLVKASPKRSAAPQRLQKILAARGVASRRQAEQLIVAGRVRVNGRVVKDLGSKADPHRDRIEVDGRRIVPQKLAYYLLHKPRQVMTTMHDPEGRPTVAALLRGVTERVFPVGRLDYHTSGALLLTNDGELAEALLRPQRQVPKVYIVKVQGHLDEADLALLRQGVQLEDGYRTRPAKVFVLREEPRHSWIQVEIVEGKNRQVHRMAKAIGHPVLRLNRHAFAELSTEGLAPGDFRALSAKELEKLKKNFGEARPAGGKAVDHADDLD